LSNPESMAKAARERLALALSALQGTPDTPEDLLALADPIAESMGILHRIERSRGSDLSGRDTALTNVRSALNSLQTMTFNHPALDQVMDHVAGCLANVHQLARYTPPAAVTTAAPSPIAATVPAAVPAPAPAPAPAAASAAVGLGGTQMMKPQPAPVAPVPGFPQPPAPAAVAPVVPVQAQPIVPVEPIAPVQPIAPAPSAAAPVPAAPPAGSTSPNNTMRIPPGQGPAVSPASPHVQPAPQPQPQPQAQPLAAHAQPFPAQPAPGFATPPRQAAAPTSAPIPKSAPTSQGGNVVVELGTHSVSNFYKGLGGNDVIEHGGIFVATYKIPKIGAQVNLRILLPGDYEFQAAGVVQWIREPHSGGDSSEPGFGARFVQITPEGRQLVYRYTRNREPMFYDDL
jgi:hypothetical protein